MVTSFIPSAVVGAGSTVPPSGEPELVAKPPLDEHAMAQSAAAAPMVQAREAMPNIIQCCPGKRLTVDPRGARTRGWVRDTEPLEAT
jgi:hypothetical protein